MSCREGWNEMPKPFRIMIYTVLGTVAAVGFGLLFGWIIVWLWNWLMPMIFGLPTITFWQGVGIFILAKILFGGFSSHGDSSKSSKKDKAYQEHWDSDGMKRKFESWKHYDEWWKTEGKAAFESFAEKADGDDGADAGDEPEEPRENE
jgi:hypothetical protein